MTEIAISERESGRVVNANRGDQIVIELTENPTTGFRWQLAYVNDSILRLDSDGNQSTVGSAIGGAGLRVFRFSAIGLGSTDVRLELKRPWEAQPPRASFTINVQIA